MTLKCRVIPTLLYRSPTLVKGAKFDNWRTFGDPVQATRVYNLRNVDELIFLDIAATRLGQDPDFDLVDEISNQCFMPLTVGGGVRSLSHIETLLKRGADKISINSAAISNLKLIQDASSHFGSQCIVVSIDTELSKVAKGYQLLGRCGTEVVVGSVMEYVQRVQDAGAGEILLTSKDRDGTMSGYDLDLIRAVAPYSTVPVIVSGGAGQEAHVVDAALIEGVAGVAMGSIFLFTEATPKSVKQCMADAGIAVRLNQ